MTKAEFISQLAKKTGLTKKDSAATLQAFLDIIQGALVKGESVVFTGWGSFVVKKTPQKKGRNPRTQQEIVIPAKKVVRFKPGKNLAEKVNK